MAAREDTVTDLMAAYLRDHGINATTRVGLEVPGEWTKEPDLTIQNDGVFVGEAKWDNEFFKAIAEAHDYGIAPSVNGAIAIAYPEGLKSEIRQTRLGEFGGESVLSKYDYQVAFLGREEGTDTSRVSLEELPEWIDGHIHRKVKPETDPEQVVTLFRQAANALTKEIEEIDTPDIFKNVIGLKPDDEEQQRAARDAAGYLLVNQIAFYRVLSSVKEKYPDIDPYELEQPSDLNKYFAKVLEDDYSAIFSFPVANAYSPEHLPLLRETVSGIYGLKPEQIDHEVLGTVFHALTPLSVRKPIAAYYTKNKSADILASLSIDDPTATVLDPACGSGTLLTAAYRRKRSLMDQFDETDHQRFLENDITGIDIMPFASHLSTIHLALEQPAYQTERVNIGIEDSTKIKPGTEISPIEHVLPESAEGQQSLSLGWDQIDAEKPGSELLKEQYDTVEKGSVALEEELQHTIHLDTVDVVMMNPPFSRQENVSHFSQEYKQNLRDRFSGYEEFIHGKMSYCSYFLLLADKFLDEGGKLAAVLPASFLTKSSDRKIRRFLLDNYSIEYLVAREDDPNFSEDTDFREILMVAQKGECHDGISYISLGNIEDINPDQIRIDAEDHSGGTIEGNGYSVRWIPGVELEEHNLFAPLTVHQPELFEVSRAVFSSEKITALDNLEVGLIGGVGSGGAGISPNTKDKDWQEGVLNAPDSEELVSLRDHDIWLVDEVTLETVSAVNRITNEKVEIAKTKLVPDFRRTPNRSKLDISELPEFAVVQDPEDDRFFQFTDYDSVPGNWEGEVTNRLGHLCLMRRIDLTAPGTRHLAYYSDENRLFHGTMWLATDISKPDAKRLAVWLDSSFNLIQMLMNRVPGRGGYTEYHKHTIFRFKVPNLPQLTDSDMELLVSTFDEVGGLEFPSIYEQLAQNTPKSELDHKEKQRLADSFPGTESLLGQGFEPRKEIDNAVLEVLGIPHQEDAVDKLYPTLLRELIALKQMMD